MYKRYFFRKDLEKGHCVDSRIDVVIAECKEEAWAITTKLDMRSVKSVEYLYERGIESDYCNCRCRCHCHCCHCGR